MTGTGTDTVVVTGASSGIGAALARELARRGRDITLVARRADRLASLAAELGGSVRAETVVADLTLPQDRERVLHEITERGLTVAGLVNCAGLGGVGRVEHADRARQLESVRVNVEALVDLTARVVPGMVGRGRGSVLHVASTGAFQPLPGQAVYGATKAFVLSYGEALREELRGTGVTVTTVCPGPVRTEYAESAGTTDEEQYAGLPPFLFRTPDQVARAGLDGLAAGRSIVVPGWGNRVTARLARLTPRPVLMANLRRTGAGMRGSQQP